MEHRIINEVLEKYNLEETTAKDLINELVDTIEEVDKLNDVESACISRAFEDWEREFEVAEINCVDIGSGEVQGLAYVVYENRLSYADIDLTFYEISIESKSGAIYLAYAVKKGE